jgi:uncharacterized membrane protein YoaK (UPF0700 family)
MNKKQMSDQFVVGVILTLVGGFLDAYTYICRGGVFANAQTGNIVLFGLSIAKGNFLGSLHYFIPILAFIAGILMAEMIKKQFKTSQKIHWRQIIIGFEIAVLACIAFIPVGTWSNLLSNIMISFVCALQVETFRKFNGNLMATTMCTGNLRSGCEFLYRFVDSRDHRDLSRSLQYFGIIVVFILGAVLGAMLTNLLGIVAILIACIGLVVVFSLMFIPVK